MMELLNGKFICTKGLDEFATIGNIYEFKDGITVWDSGCNSTTFADIHDYNKRCLSQIAPYKPPQPKDLLQMGRIVKHRNGNMGFVMNGNIIYKFGYNRIDIINDELLDRCNESEWDIIEIYKSNNRSHFEIDDTIIYISDLVWKREELTPEQIERKAIEQRQREIADEQKDLADRLAKLNNV